MEQGMEPEVKRFFKKIIATICYGIFWLAFVVTAGLYFRFAWDNTRPLVYIIIFYVIAIAGLFFLLRFFYKTWKK